MKRVLIDTQALIWSANGSPRLSRVARALIDNPSVVQLASAASLWEMAIKVPLGKLTLRAGSLARFATQLTVNDIAVLPVTGDDAVAVAALPSFAGHKNPFDRLIAAQCLRRDLTLVSIDAAFDPYGVRRMW